MAETTLAQSSADFNRDAILAELNDRGYCLIPSVISPAHADEVRGILEEILRKEQKDAHRSSGYQRVSRIAVKHPAFLDLMCHPVIYDLWSHWLGKDVICSTWTGNTLYPGHTAIGWHADFPYWSITPPWPTGNLTGQTLWLLDDFTEENGGTGVVPYSHRTLVPPDQHKEWRDDAEIIVGVRGSVAVLHGALWHTARPNQSQKPRSALLGMYIRPCCLTQENMRGQLADLHNPTDLVKQLMGANQYQPADVVTG